MIKEESNKQRLNSKTTQYKPTQMQNNAIKKLLLTVESIKSKINLTRTESRIVNNKNPEVNTIY